MQSLRIVMLLTDAYGGYGGISEFNRNFLAALDASALVERVHVVPRIISEPIDQRCLPESIVYDRGAALGKIAFLKSVWKHSWRADRVNLLVCGHVHLLPAAWIFARTHRVRLALLIYGIEAWAPTRHRVANRFASRVDALISVSRVSAVRFETWSGFPAKRSFILHPCVDLDRFAPHPRDPALVARYGLASSRVIMTVGRLESRERRKGFDEVITAMPHLLACFPGLKYMVVGDGTDRGRLEDLVRQKGISGHVIFTGKVLESEKAAHYNLADAYVMPSSAEGFGIVLIEAAACGLPVIGSLADGSQEALLDGRLGRVIDPENAQHLIEAVTEALNASVRTRNRLIHQFGVPRFQETVGLWLKEQSQAITAAQTRAVV